MGILGVNLLRSSACSLLSPILRRAQRHHLAHRQGLGRLPERRALDSTLPYPTVKTAVVLAQIWVAAMFLPWAEVLTLGVPDIAPLDLIPVSETEVAAYDKDLPKGVVVVAPGRGRGRRV